MTLRLVDSCCCICLFDFYSADNLKLWLTIYLSKVWLKILMKWPCIWLVNVPFINVIYFYITECDPCGFIKLLNFQFREIRINWLVPVDLQMFLFHEVIYAQ